MIAFSQGNRSNYKGGGFGKTQGIFSINKSMPTRPTINSQRDSILKTEGPIELFGSKVKPTLVLSLD
jgi:hypothetical protein